MEVVGEEKNLAKRRHDAIGYIIFKYMINYKNKSRRERKKSRWIELDPSSKLVGLQIEVRA